MSQAAKGCPGNDPGLLDELHAPISEDGHHRLVQHGHFAVNESLDRAR